MPDGVVTCRICGRECKGRYGLGAHLKAHNRMTLEEYDDGDPGAYAPPGSIFDAPPPSQNGHEERDVPRATFDVNLGLKGGKSADPALEAVRQRAEQVATVVALAFFFTGHELDAADVERGKAQWAEAVKGVAVHEEWLRKLCQGGEASERLMAWLKLGGATIGIAAPILNRHGSLPEPLARLLGMASSQAEQMMAAQAEQMAPVPGAPADSPEPAAAA